MGLEVGDIFITLTPRERWKRAETQAGLVKEMSELTEKLPGMRAAYTQPIEMRINEMVSGIRADVGIKLYGDDLATLKAKAEEILRVVLQIPGAADVGAEQITGQPVLRVEVDWEALSRYGVSARQVLDAVKAAGGIAVGEVLEPGRRFPVVVRLPESYRDDPHALEHVLIATATGQRLPLTQLARLEEVTGPSTIQRDWGLRRIVVQTNVRGRDVGSFVAEAQRRINEPGGHAERLHARMGRPVRAHATIRAAALHRRAAGPRTHPEPALPDVSFASGCAHDLQRGALRPHRRRFRPVVHGPAVHHLGRRRLHRARRSLDARRARSRRAPSATGSPRGSPNATPSSRPGWHGCDRC